MEEIIDTTTATKPYLLATLEYPPQVGGVASFCAQFVKALPADSIQVISNQTGDLLSAYIWPHWLKAVHTLWKEVKKTQARGIIVAQVLPLGTAAVVVGKLTHTPVYITVHGLDVLRPQSSKWKTILLCWVLRSAKVIIANSRYTAQVVQGLGVTHEKISILPLGPHLQPADFPVSDASWIKELGIPDQATVILSVARLIKRKGIDHVIEVFPEVKKHFPTQEIFLVIAGDGPERPELERLTKISGERISIKFTGRISDEQLAQLFQRCQLFVLPTRQEAGGDVEGFGIVFLEANAFGKPVIGGKSGGVPDAVVDGLSGYLIEPNNLDMLLKAMIKLIEHPEIAARLGQQGKLRVAEQFNWQVNVQLLAKHIGILE